MVDLEAAEDIVDAASSTVRAAGCWLPPATATASSSPEDECLANTRKGKQVLNVKAPAEARLRHPCRPPPTMSR